MNTFIFVIVHGEIKHNSATFRKNFYQIFAYIKRKVFFSKMEFSYITMTVSLRDVLLY